MTDGEELLASEWTQWDATAVAQHIRARRVSVREVTEHVLARIDESQRTINSHTVVRTQQARAEADAMDRALADGRPSGPLCGVPVSVKDVIWSAGDLSTSGSAITRDFVPTVDATIVARTRSAGGIVVGKTNNSEFCFRGVSENELFGATRNPWDLDCTSGGSSGGAAAAVADRLEPLALASDGGGSIRMPSSFCGVAGIKPTHGRVPAGPGPLGWGSLGDNGLIAVSVRDLRTALAVVQEPEWTRTELASAGGRPLRHHARIAVSEDLGHVPLDDDVRAGFATAVERLRASGWDIENVDPPGGDPYPAWNVIAAAEGYAANRRILEEHRDMLEPSTVSMLEAGRTLSAADYVDALASQSSYTGSWRAFFARYDAVLCPTTQQTAFPVGQGQPRRLNGSPWEFPPMGWAALCIPANLTGNPAVSIPGGVTSAGMPFGMQLIGPRDLDLYLLDVAEEVARTVLDGDDVLLAPGVARER